MLSPPRVFGLVVATVLLVSGGALAVAQYSALAEYESTTGTVETAGIAVVPEDSVRPDLSNATISGERLYVPNVTYTYTVDGETYTGGNVASGTDIMMGDRNKTAAALSSVQPGPTTVYYHPSDPTDAHLLRHLDFFPAGILLTCGFLVVADAVTPRPRLARLFTTWLPLETLERLPGVEAAATTEEVGDPTEILTAKRTWAGVDPAPFRGGAARAIWLFCLLLVTDIVLAYFLVSAPPYDLWAVAAGGVVAAGVGRLGFSRILQ